MSIPGKGVVWGLTTTIVGMAFVTALFAVSGGAGTGWHSPTPLLIRAVLVDPAFGVGAFLIGGRN